MNRVKYRSNKRQSTATLVTGYGYYGYRRGLYGGFPAYTNDVDTVHYKVGTVNIDVVDAKKKQLVWEGAQEGRLTKKVMDNVEAAVNTVVGNIYQQYPTRVIQK